jgi:ankyrin repeat protein
MRSLQALASVVFLAIASPCVQALPPPTFDELTSQSLWRRTDDYFIAGINAGDSVTARDARGQTLLFTAVQYGLLRASQMLLDQGAIVDAANVGGTPPLMLTIHRGTDTRLPQLLLRHGADPNHADKEGMTPLLLAAGDNRADLIRLLVKAGAKVDEKAEGHYGVPALESAAGFGNIEAMKALLACGAPVDEKDGQGYTALGAALTYDHGEAASLLLKAGANPNGQMFRGGLFVVECIQRHHLKALAALVAAHADLDLICQNFTPLVWAVEDDIPALRVLIAGKVDLNKTVRCYFINSGPGPADPAKNYDVRTPLMMAVVSDKPEAIKILLEAGRSQSEGRFRSYRPRSREGARKERYRAALGSSGGETLA